jgi:hypothetical protein
MFIDRIARSWLEWRMDQTAKRHNGGFYKVTLAPDGFYGDWVAPEIAYIADQCAAMLEKADAPNYVSFDMMTARMRPVRVTVQWADGESPAEQNARLRKEIERIVKDKSRQTTKMILTLGGVK